MASIRSCSASAFAGVSVSTPGVFIACFTHSANCLTHLQQCAHCPLWKVLRLADRPRYALQSTVRVALRVAPPGRRLELAAPVATYRARRRRHAHLRPRAVQKAPVAAGWSLRVGWARPAAGCSVAEACS